MGASADCRHSDNDDNAPHAAPLTRRFLKIIAHRRSGRDFRDHGHSDLEAENARWRPRRDAQPAPPRPRGRSACVRLGRTQVAPTTTETAARLCAAVELRQCEKSSPVPGSVRRHPTMKLFASKAAGSGRARGVIWAEGVSQLCASRHPAPGRPLAHRP